ncbi:hypothetical protein PsYK624_021580 [Phanerochaete sordida]|uniref:Uncharacterized protein n=1 Tax=Phanerochaete sordida TaxID=48140 RepID=A0A9P3G0Q0_9APHY|nr:hypothetical protein PsYK624_021580 [Phanerochaete sordida]
MYVEDPELLHNGKDFTAASSSLSCERLREPAGSFTVDRSSLRNHQRSCPAPARKSPIRLISPSGELDTWAIAVGPAANPSELLVIQSSTPFSQVMDELCEMMARWSLRDDPVLSSTSSPDSAPLAIDDISTAFTSLSLEDFSPPTPPQVEGDLDLWDEEPLFCGNTSFCDTDAESVCDSISDATCVEEESIVSWTTVCEDPQAKEDPSDGKKDTLLEDIMSGLQEHITAKREFAVAHSSAPAVSCPFTISAVVLVGLQCWRSSSPTSVAPLFAPALRKAFCV